MWSLELRLNQFSNFQFAADALLDECQLLIGAHFYALDINEGKSIPIADALTAADCLMVERAVNASGMQLTRSVDYCTGHSTYWDHLNELCNIIEDPNFNPNGVVLSGWSTSCTAEAWGSRPTTDPCLTGDWFGVTCTRLYLYPNGYFTFIYSIDLSFRKIGGQIPAAMTNTAYGFGLISLDSCDIQGLLPSSWKNTKVVSLDSNPSLGGRIPTFDEEVHRIYLSNTNVSGTLSGLADLVANANSGLHAIDVDNTRMSGNVSSAFCSEKVRLLKISGSGFNCYPSCFLTRANNPGLVTNFEGLKDCDWTQAPSAQPSVQPLSNPTTVPTSLPTGEPTTSPSAEPTTTPSGQPSRQPTVQPSGEPSSLPTGQPSARPFSSPTSQPTSQPTSEPSSGLPSSVPSSWPTSYPSSMPVVANCSAGWYLSSDAERCNACPLGTFKSDESRNGRDACQPCQPGTFSGPTPGASECEECPGGHFQSSYGSIHWLSCGKCAPGYYAPQGAAKCQRCRAGTYSNLEGTVRCPPCPAGTTSFVGATECIPCPAGRFQILMGANKCPSCPAGTHQNMTGQIDCNYCPPGTMSIDGAINCTPCAVGSYNAGIGATMCLPCEPGTYGPTLGLSTCLPCRAGEMTLTRGAINCSAYESIDF
jgi:hypothetical protein